MIITPHQTCLPTTYDGGFDVEIEEATAKTHFWLELKNKTLHFHQPVEVESGTETEVVGAKGARPVWVTIDQKWSGEKKRRGVEFGCRRDREGEDLEEQKKGSFGIKRSTTEER